jgi:hypothetical protein
MGFLNLNIAFPIILALFIGVGLGLALPYLLGLRPGLPTFNFEEGHGELPEVEGVVEEILEFPDRLVPVVPTSSRVKSNTGETSHWSQVNIREEDESQDPEYYTIILPAAQIQLAGLKSGYWLRVAETRLGTIEGMPVYELLECRPAGTPAP